MPNDNPFNSNGSDDPYEILGVSRLDDINKITQIYRKLALKYHPDKNNNNNNNNNNKDCEEKFKAISKAYHEILKKKIRHNKNTEMKNGFINKINYLKNLLLNFKNLEVSSILTNLIKEFNVITDLYNEKNENLKKTDNLNINVTIDIFDIYNSIEKTITIELLRKCIVCFGIGLIINNKNTFTICGECDGLKLMTKKIDIVFNCKYKMALFSGMSNHSLSERPGDIVVSIFPKFISNPELTEIKLDDYEIINYYNLLFKHFTSETGETGETGETTNANELLIYLFHLDNKKYSVKICNPIFNYRYKIDNMGLLKNDSGTCRGCLYIELINSINSFNGTINTINTINTNITLTLNE